MALGYRSSSVSGTSDTFGSSKAVPVPAGAAADDIAIVALEQWESGNPAVTPPTGFTQFVQIISGSQKLKLFWKRLTTSETGSWTFSWTGSQWSMAHAILMTGAVTTGDPIGTNFNTATSASGTSVPSTSVTTAFNPGLTHFIANENAATKTPPTSHTEVQDGDYLETNYRLPAGTGTFTASGGTLSVSTLSLAALVALEPAAAGGGTPASGVGTVGLSASGTAVKVASVSGVCSMGFAAAGAAAKRTPAAGVATIGAAAGGAAAKRAPAAGVTTTALAAAGAAAKVAAASGIAAAGLLTYSAAAKKAQVVGVSTVGLAATRSELVVRAVSGVCAFGLTGASTVGKTAAESGVAALGTTAAGTAAKWSPHTGACTVGVAGTGTAAKHAALAGVAPLGIAGGALAAKRATVFDVAPLGLTTFSTSGLEPAGPTPAERTFTVAAEDRTIRAVDTRTLAVAAELRTAEA